MAGWKEETPTARHAAFVLLLSAALLLPASIALDTLIAVWNGWRPQAWPLRIVGASSLLFCGLTALFLVIPAGQRLLRRWATPLALSSLSVLAAWIGAEFFLRSRPPFFHLHPPDISVECKPKAGLLPGVEGTTTLSFNSRGMRGPELDEDGDAYRILCVGGSTTECFYLDDSEAWPQLVMDAVGSDRLWINNAGSAGYGLRHHVKFLRESDLVADFDAVILLIGVNDFILGARTPPKSNHPRWFELQTTEFVTAALRGRNPSLFVEDLGAVNYGRRRKLRQLAPKRDTLWDLSPSLVDYELNIRNVVQILAERDIRPIFLTQPVLWREGLPPEIENRNWFGKLDGGAYLTAAAMREGLDAFNKRLLAVTRELDVECVDLSELHGVSEFFYDDCHFSTAGSWEVARLLLDHLEGPQDIRVIESSAPRADR